MRSLVNLSTRLFFFAMAFTLDVRVHAAEIVNLPNARDVLQEPENCLRSGDRCLVRTREDEKFKMPVGSETVVLMSDSAAIRDRDAEVTLVAGQIWIQSVGPFTVHTLYGDVVSTEGDFWVKQDSKRVWVTATSSSLILEPKSSARSAGRVIETSAQDLRLDTGEENWLGPVDKFGRATTGVPTVMNFSEHIVRWAKLFPGTKKQFVRAVSEFQEKWIDQVHSVAKFHQELAERKLASIDDQAAKEAQRRRQVEQRNHELRTLFRRKQNED